MNVTSFLSRARGVTAGNYGGFNTKDDWKKFQYTTRMKQLEESKATYEAHLKSGTPQQKSMARAMLQGISLEMSELKKRHKTYFGSYQ